MERATERGREGKKRAHTSGAETSRCSGGGGGPAEGLSRERAHCFNLQTSSPLPNYSQASARCMARSVIGSETDSSFQPARSPLSLRVGCKVDLGLKKKSLCHHAAGAPITGSESSRSGCVQTCHLRLTGAGLRREPFIPLLEDCNGMKLAVT